MKNTPDITPIPKPVNPPPISPTKQQQSQQQSNNANKLDTNQKNKQ